MKKSVVIIGAGISGLSVGWGLAGTDYEVNIIEFEQEVGGLAGSFIKNGYVFDYGPHAFYTKDPEIYYAVKELLKDDLLTFGEMYSKIKIIFQGQTYDYPLSITSILANMKLPVLLRCTFDYFLSLAKRRFHSPPNITFEDWVTNHFGKTLYNTFFGPYTEKTWGVPPARLAANFASERIPKLNIRKMIKELFRTNMTRTNTHIHTDNNFNQGYSYYPRKGSWQLADTIKKEVESKGGRIHLRSLLKSLIIEDGHIGRVLFKKNGKVEEIRPDFVVSTIPIPELSKVLQPLDNEIKSAGLNMIYRELTLLFLQVNKKQVFDARLVYFHDPDVLFQRGSEIKFLSEKTVPSETKTSVTLEITNRNHLTDDEIYDLSVIGLENLGLLRKTDIEGHCIVRQPYAYPIYDVNYKANLDTFMNGISKIDNLTLCGRQALFRYIDMDQCIKMGLIIAQSLQGDQPLDDLDTVVAQWSVEALKK